MTLAKKAGKIGGLTFLSRIFGLIREQLFAALLGAGYFADAFIIAFRIPNLLRDLFAEGALSNAFVPTFTQTRIQESEINAWQVVRIVFAWILIVVGSLTLLMIFFAPALVELIAPGFGNIEGKKDITILLTQIMSPFLLFVSLASVLMGIHNSYSRFSLPALAPVFFNWVSIGCGLIIWWAGFEANLAVIGWAIGTLLGGIAQFAIQLPPFLKAKMNIWPSFKGMTSNAHVKQIFLLMIPSVIALSGTQINILVNSILASMLEQGAPSWLNYAFRLMQLPIGVFGVAISVVALSQASKDVANKQPDQFITNVQSSVQLSYLLTIPCAVGLCVLAEPIIHLIYERGAFTHQDTLQTAQALMYYAIGLPFYASVKVKAPIFFTMRSSKIPMMASLVGVGFNIVFNLMMYKQMGHRGLALGTSLGVMLNSAILTFFYHRITKAPYSIKSASTRLKIILASAAMGLVAHFLWSRVYLAGATSTMEVFIYPLMIILFSGLIYAAILSMWNVPEMKNLIHTIQRKIFRQD
jgi:putative peptidoglycan lipid II flippase